MPPAPPKKYRRATKGALRTCFASLVRSCGGNARGSKQKQPPSMRQFLSRPCQHFKARTSQQLLSFSRHAGGVICAAPMPVSERGGSIPRPLGKSPAGHKKFTREHGRRAPRCLPLPPSGAAAEGGGGGYLYPLRGVAPQWGGATGGE